MYRAPERGSPPAGGPPSSARRACLAELVPLLDDEGQVVVVLRLADHRDVVRPRGLEGHRRADLLHARALRAYELQRRHVQVLDCDGAVRYVRHGVLRPDLEPVAAGVAHHDRNDLGRGREPGNCDEESENADDEKLAHCRISVAMSYDAIERPGAGNGARENPWFASVGSTDLLTEQLLTVGLRLDAILASDAALRRHRRARRHPAGRDDPPAQAAARGRRRRAARLLR